MVKRRGRRGSLAKHAAWALLAMAVFAAVALAGPAGAATGSASGAAAAGTGGDSASQSQPVRTNVLAKIYQSGNARLSRGDTAGALGAFKTVAEIAPELADAQLSAAVTALLNDFAHRDVALQMLQKAHQSNPLAEMLSVFADPQYSLLRPDGALYVTSGGAARLRDAGQRLTAYKAARNGRYIAQFLASGQNTGEANFPLRYADFNKTVGPGGQFKLPQWTQAVLFGQLFILTIEEGQFAPYEPRLIARLQNGLKSLDDNQLNLKRVRDRIAELRSQLESNDPKERMVALSKLDSILADLDTIIASNDQTVSQLKVIVDNADVKSAAQIAENKKKIADQEAEIARLRSLGKAMDAETEGKKKALSAVQQQYMGTVSKMNAAQRRLNDLQGKLAQEQTRLAGTEQQAATLERATRQRAAELEAIRKRQDELQKQQQSSAQQAELSQLQGRKSAVEANLQAEESKLASIRGERERLQREVDDIKAQQQQHTAEHDRLAAILNKIDFGRYYALVIGNDAYQEWPRLSTAVDDAQSIADLLQKKYGFKVRVLANATRKQLLGAFEEYIEELGPSDNLLVYYAGHGILDDKGAGYWVPVDASLPKNLKLLHTEELVRHDDVISAIQRLHAKQVLVVADSCFSGGLALAAMNAAPPIQTAALQLPTAIRTRGLKIVDADGDIPVGQIQGTVAAAGPDMSSEEVTGLMRLASLPARVVLTSGGLEPVADQLNAKDKHSIFAAALLKALEKNKGLLKSIELTNTVQDDVIRKTGSAASRGAAGGGGAQTPNSTNLMGYSGDFLFIARN
jgi:predicted  nucleic acid-binding Zn-ribbon protein